MLLLVSFQLFYSFFKSLIGKDVVVELKNDLRYAITTALLLSVIDTADCRSYNVSSPLQYPWYIALSRPISECEVNRYISDRP